MPVDAQNNVTALAASEKIRAACDFLQRDHARRVAEMREIALVQGETGKEHMARSPAYRKMLARDGARDCVTDALGNVFGFVRGVRENSPLVLCEAHLDTVFLEETPLAVHEENGLLYCPGIGDNAAGLSLILSLLRAVRHADLVPVYTLMAAGTACEEAQGNFNGMRKLIADHPGIAASITIDDDGNDRICRNGVGIKRAEFIFRGEGGHSWMDFGVPACLHALCRAMAAIAGMELPDTPKTTVNVGVISGGTSVAAIAVEARAHVDMRSLSAVCLATLEERVYAHVRDAVAEENAYRGKDCGVTVECRPYSDIPAAMAGDDSPAVLAAVAASRAMGLEANMNYSGSTNANIPMSLGIPALTLGYGGVSRNIHSLRESYDPTDAYRAAQKALLTIFALAGLEGVCDPLV